MADYDQATALLVVDVQNDFADPRGSLYVRGGEEVVEAVNRELVPASDAGATVVYTQDWHPPDTPHFAKDGGVWPVHCVAGTWGAQLHPDVNMASNSEFVYKGVEGEDGYSGFSVREPTTGARYATPLGTILAQRGISQLVIVGLATDYCVKETALDAVRLGYPTTVVLDAVRAVDLSPGDGERALDELRAAGVTLV